MGILVDGYNLLNATGVEGIGGGTELERARRGLLTALAGALSEVEVSATTVVFDAQGAPPGLPREERFRGITVLYARGYAEADDLLEELIAADHAPRQLLVVSSDHRLHRAARRRRATPIDSDVWFAQLQVRDGSAGAALASQKPAPTPELTDSWLAEFGHVDVEAIDREVRGRPAAPAADDASAHGKSPPADTEHSRAKEAKGKSPRADLNEQSLPFPEDFGAELEEDIRRDASSDLWDPFPPGYGEDLTDEELTED